MEFWTRVAIQSPTEVRTPIGGTRYVFATILPDVEARVLPVTDERPMQWATPEEDAYEVHLRGSHPSVIASWRLLVDGEPFDIRRVIPALPFGIPTTVLQCVKVTP